MQERLVVPSVFAVTEKPRIQQPQLGDFIRTAPAARNTTTSNRFQPLSLSVWQDIVAKGAAEKSKSDVIHFHLRASDPWSCGLSAATGVSVEWPGGD